MSRMYRLCAEQTRAVLKLGSVIFCPGRRNDMRRTYFILILGLLCSVLLCSQELLKAPRFPQAAYFRRHFAERMPRVEERGRDRLEEFVGHTLELSVRSYLE